MTLKSIRTMTTSKWPASAVACRQLCPPSLVRIPTLQRANSVTFALGGRVGLLEVWIGRKSDTVGRLARLHVCPTWAVWGTAQRGLFCAGRYARKKQEISDSRPRWAVSQTAQVGQTSRIAPPPTYNSAKFQLR